MSCDSQKILMEQIVQMLCQKILPKQMSKDSGGTNCAKFAVQSFKIWRIRLKWCPAKRFWWSSWLGCPVERFWWNRMYWCPVKRCADVVSKDCGGNIAQMSCLKILLGQVVRMSWQQIPVDQVVQMSCQKILKVKINCTDVMSIVKQIAQNLMPCQKILLGQIIDISCQKVLLGQSVQRSCQMVMLEQIKQSLIKRFWWNRLCRCSVKRFDWNRLNNCPVKR